MATEPISFLAPVTATGSGIAGLSSDAQTAPDFASWLADSVSRVNSDLARADEGLQQLATGEAPDLHHVMIALEEARLGVQLLVQVRNHLLDAYQEVLRMQV
jgi:flagellar hook-basal body complex protein FliE